jgi:hypothetical protein
LAVLFLDNRSIRRSFIFSFEAALCGVLSYAMHNIYQSSAIGVSTKVSFSMVVFQLLIESCLALINLLPASIIRALILRKPASDNSAVMASFCCYASVYLIAVVPYNIFTGQMPLSSIWIILSLAADIGWAALSYAGSYSIVTMAPLLRDTMNELFVPLNDSEKCLTMLGDFMSLLHKQLGERRRMEKLWQPVYAYLKDLARIQKLVRNKGLRHDEIVLNAVGGTAYKILSSGKLHASFGVLSPDGEYVRKVWWIAANELVRRSYNKPEDVTQGLEALDAAIVSVGAQE